MSARRAAGCAALALLVASCGGDERCPPVEPTLDRVPPPARPVGMVIPGRYVVVLRPAFARAVTGFAATLTDDARRRLAADPRVAYIEPDRVVAAAATESDAPWGLDRIDQRALPLSGTFTATSDGAGVTAYILDTGIRFDHVDFGGRAEVGFDALGGDGADCHGHGTHVAGTVGGHRFGVAKTVRLVSVRVLDCKASGTLSSLIAGIDWVTEHHTPGAPAVANMSIDGDSSQALDDAIARSIASGVSYTVAAGNRGRDACGDSPARVAAAITVGSSDRTDRRASDSNFGPCVDWYAPGVGIVSAGLRCATSTAIKSGTSMASAHAAGVAALYLTLHPGASPAEVQEAIRAQTTRRVVGNAGAVKGDLLFTDY